MKTKFYFFGKLALSAVLVAMLSMLFSCKKEKTPEDGPQGGGYAAGPFTKISATADGETVEGVADHSALTILFAFDKAENFYGSLSVELNDGYTLAWPADPADYKIGDDIYFKDPDRKNVIYKVSATSNALPVVDASKITVEGGYTMTFDLGAKEFVIVYADGMDRSNVVITFGEGSFIGGATVSQTSWDLSEGPSTVSIMVNGTAREYTVRLDYSAVLTSPAEWGFSDITTSAQKAKYPSLKVWKAESLLKQVPAQTSGVETHAWWNNDNTFEDQVAKVGWLGDYSDSREKVDVASCEFYIVTFDAAAFCGSLSGQGMPENVNASIAMTGAPVGTYPILKVDGSMVNTTVGNGWTGPFGTFVGFDSAGKMCIGQAELKDGDLVSLPYFVPEEFGYVYGEIMDDDNFSPRDQRGGNIKYYGDYRQGVWQGITGATYVNPMVVRNNTKLRFVDILINDGDTETFGHGWNGSRARSFIGKTIDNKIGLACITSRNMSVPQAAYVLYELGWTDICYSGGDFYADPGFFPSLYIDGEKVAGIEGQTAACIYNFNAR